MTLSERLKKAAEFQPHMDIIEYGIVYLNADRLSPILLACADLIAVTGHQCMARYEDEAPPYDISLKQLTECAACRALAKLDSVLKEQE